jgi:two-component system, NtrC family, response regulator AtoC
MARVLIVDDEPGIRRVLSLFLSGHGHAVVEAASGEEAIELSSRTGFDAVLLDLSLGGMTGLETLKQLRDRDAALACIVITAHGNIRNAVDAIRAGAVDFLTKPFDNDQLLLSLDQAMTMRRLAAEVESLRAALETRYGFNEIVGISGAMQHVFRMMDRFAASQDSVLIEGESGTGKELVARAIHRRSTRANGPFITVNSAAIPQTLIEAEFFGVERGAYTDARESRPGRFELAHGGTLFLDEVGDLPLEAQAKLLRVLQNHEVSRLGSGKVLRVNVRVIAATNKNLEAEIRRERFREDLYYRLAVLTVRLPPLRERSEDLPLLIDYFIEAMARESQVSAKTLAAEVKRLLLAYHWPGNVRELENTLRRALALSDGPGIRAIDLPARIRGQSAGRPELATGRTTLGQAVAAAVERVERALIQDALSEHGGSRTAAAESLGINRKTLFNKMKGYGMVAAGDDDE